MPQVVPVQVDVAKPLLGLRLRGPCRRPCAFLNVFRASPASLREHVTEEPQRPVDGRRGEPSALQTVDHSRPLQVRDEVVDVGRLDLGDRPIPEPFDQRLQPVIENRFPYPLLRPDGEDIVVLAVHGRQHPPMAITAVASPLERFLKFLFPHPLILAGLLLPALDDLHIRTA